MSFDNTGLDQDRKIWQSADLWLEPDAFENFFGLWLDLDWVLTNPHWIWRAKYDSPLISDYNCLMSIIITPVTDVHVEAEHPGWVIRPELLTGQSRKWLNVTAPDDFTEDNTLLLPWKTHRIHSANW